MSVEKKYLKSKPVCKVRFVAPPELVNGAKSIAVAGDFNNWDTAETKLRKQKSGEYATTIELEVGHEYQYRYVINGTRWENDYGADKYVPNNLSYEENSVVVV